MKPVTGENAAQSWNAGTIIGDGSLLLGSDSSNKAYQVDLTNPAGPNFAPFAFIADSPGGSSYGSTGDFSVATNGDILWLVSSADGNFIAGIPGSGQPSGTGANDGLYEATILAELDDSAFGAGRVNDDLYLVETGVYRVALSDIPSIAEAKVAGFVVPKLEPVLVLENAGFASMYGAAGTGDSGVQLPACGGDETTPVVEDLVDDVVTGGNAESVTVVVADEAEESLARTGQELSGVVGLSAVLLLAGVLTAAFARIKRGHIAE